VGELVNLRRVRKQRDRAEASRQAEENRARFGRSKADKQTEAAEIQRRDTVLDGHRRDHPEKS